MTENFNTYIDRVDADMWRELCLRNGKLRHFERGEEFIRIGEVGRYIGYIKSGTLKYVAYSTNGTEHVVGLEFTGEFVTDFPFSLYGQKARVSIIASSPCDIYCLPVKRVTELMESDQRVADNITKSTRELFSTLYDRYIALHTQSAQQRYNHIVTQYPNLFELFPLKDIASYLNITPTHLSRLRKNDENLG